MRGFIQELVAHELAGFCYSAVASRDFVFIDVVSKFSIAETDVD